MNKKITISELSQLLSSNTSLINKKGWEDFLKIFFAQISEGLQAEGNVKIKGLGTFKVVTVDARKSKDVNTGANTVIPAHNKISFTPDSSLAETLNKPYAHFEPTYVLAPDGEVDAPENDDEEETVAEEVKSEASETVVEVAAAAISNQINESEQIVDNTVDAVAETIVEQATATTETANNVISETEKEIEKTVEEAAETVVEQTTAATEAANNVISETEKEIEKTVEEAAETVVEQTTAATEAANNVISETEKEIETVVENATEPTQDNDAEEAEDKEEEDPNADEDENLDTNPAEIAKYASTIKRHDLPKEKVEEEEDKSGHGKRLGIAIILFLCILAVVALVAWMSDPNIVSKIRSKITEGDEVKTEIKVDPVEAAETKAIEDQIIAEKAESDTAETNAIVDSLQNAIPENSEATEESVSTKQSFKSTTKFKDDFISYMKVKHPEMDITDKGDPIEEKLGQASRLTLVSLRHYGSKDFWVYIYLYNKDVIKNPNNIKAGTKIKVPDLDRKKFVNPESEHSILTAKEVQHKFVK